MFTMLPDAALLSPPPTFPAVPPMPPLPQRLAAEPPGWVTEVDVVVIGSGIAGLTAALECRDLGQVMVVTKHVLEAGSTNWAQGGIASVQAAGDTVDQHIRDTLVAGAGLCVEEAVRVLVSEGPDEVAKLIARGAEFDRDAAGELALTREGGHLRNRIAHAGGDATGAEIERALVSTVTADPGIEIIEHALVLDLIPAEVGPGEPPAVAGVTLHVLGEGTRGGVGAVHARAVVLATGGIGQIYAVTTNPPVSTGDGVAAALRAGARLRDIEFIQFHPTVLYLGAGARG
ncbi:MAG TPA: FAD-binding protein, partial [Propionibacteriaceae bacterium]|nr:FAD-binding protein [Propionibacteriaceae bacterium]